MFVNIHYADGSTIRIDSAVVIQKPGNTVFFRAGASKPGTETGYNIINDSRQKELQGKKINVTFLAYKNGSVLVSRDFVIGADECHVQIFSGNNDIVINK
ncbi:MAG: hypothetical protein INR69_17940 [Mucilaginibacter polytrichastri]|nr:hypothetical protein [Mucilaginibacter polytrichastri]